MQAKVMRIILFLLIISGITLAVIYRDQFDAEIMAQWVNNAGIAGPIVFMVIYAIGTVFFLPGSILTLTGGAIFGPLLGTLYNLTGATIGATIAFIISRYLASDWVENKTGGRLKQLKDGVEEEGWRFVAFVRLVPLFPFNILNYALGLTRIKLSHYIIASYICMLPGAFAYTYLGYASREAISGGEGLIQKSLLALSLLAVVAFIPRIVARYRRSKMVSVQELKQKQDDNSDFVILDVRIENDFVGEQGHIANAVNIPLEQLANRLTELDDRYIAIVCRTDRRSAKAAQLLSRKNFTNVHIIRGGMTDWIAKGFPVNVNS